MMMAVLPPKERQLIDWGKESLGESLLAIILAGFAREDHEPIPDFLVGENKKLGKVRYIISLDNKASYELPIRREPLILLGCLYTIIELEQEVAGEILFPANQLLDLLGWSESPANVERVDQAITKYFNMELTVTKDLRYISAKVREESEDTPTGNINTYRYITSCQSHVGRDGKMDLEKFSYDRVSLSQHLVRGLKKREVFSINWNDAVLIKTGRFKELWYG